MFTFNDTHQHHANIKAFLPHLKAYNAESDADNFSGLVTYCIHSLRVPASQVAAASGLSRGTVSNWGKRYRTSTPENRIKVKEALLLILQTEEQRLFAILKAKNPVH